MEGITTKDFRDADAIAATESRDCLGCRQSRETAVELTNLLSTIVDGYEAELERRLGATMQCAKTIPVSLNETDARHPSPVRSPHLYRNKLESCVSIHKITAIPGFSIEMRKLGDRFFEGELGYPVDQSMAFRYWEAAALCGCTESCLRVGKHFMEQNSAETDVKAAYFLNAATESSVEACYHLAILLYTGRGDPAVLEDVAAESGDSTKRSPVNAEQRVVALLERAAGEGHALAAYQLASMYAQGEGVGRDRLRAHKLLQQWEQACAPDAQDSSLAAGDSPEKEALREGGAWREEGAARRSALGPAGSRWNREGEPPRRGWAAESGSLEKKKGEAGARREREGVVRVEAEGGESVSGQERAVAPERKSVLAAEGALAALAL